MLEAEVSDEPGIQKGRHNGGMIKVASSFISATSPLTSPVSHACIAMCDLALVMRLQAV